MIALFDMDGTLTPPRKKMDPQILEKLKELSAFATIGIVTGSDFEYVAQQCTPLLQSQNFPVEKLELFPCNGTKHYRSDSDGKFELVHDVNMIDEIGQEEYNYIIQSLLGFQIVISVTHDLPYTGTFFQYRGSMLNWCPVGRSAGPSERDAWISLDKEKNVRKHFLNELNQVIEKRGVKVSAALGGSTSVDIYPEGWDKTYVLNHLEDCSKIYFVGDMCMPGGNDFALYDFLESSGNAFKTTGPECTSQIIDKIISSESQGSGK